MANGLFIVFEGIDGSGKTSQAKKLQQFMAAAGREVIMTEEPRKKSLGQWVRQKLLHTRHSSEDNQEAGGDKAYPSSPSGEWQKEIDDLTMVYMLLAARAEHVADVILPALAAGKVVICDRFSHSTLAYQGYGAGVDIELIEKLSQPISAMVKPDRVFLIDIAPQAARLRLEMGREGKDTMEEKPIEFFEKVRLGFLTIARDNPSLVKIIDGLDKEEVVAAAIEKNIQPLLKN